MLKYVGVGGVVFGMLWWLLLPVVAAAACVGDCNEDGFVTWRELALAGDRAVGKARNCPAADANNDGQVYVEEVVLAVSSLYAGCAGAPTRTPSPTRTNAPTATATSSPTPESAGPVIVYFGLARADNVLIPPDPVSAPDGTPIFTREFVGAGFLIVVEARPGSSGFAVGTRTTPQGDSRPDLQIQANRDLGNGSRLVCDAGPIRDGLPLGGVPGIHPPSFAMESQEVTDALVDFGCRFSNSTGEWCTQDAAENPNPATPGVVSGLTQFCTHEVIGAALHFPAGDTLLTAQVRSCIDFECTDSLIGSPARIIVRSP